MTSLKKNMRRYWATVRQWLAACILLCVFGASAPAFAQSATVSNTTVGTINGTTTCTAPLVRNFNVTSSFTVNDVNLGMLATHTWRGDIRLTLQSPSGTRVQLVNGDTNNLSGDNYNVLLDDGAASLVNTDGNTTNHSTSAPPYQNNFRPNSPLSAFNGQNSAGTWRLEICDQFPTQDDGQFRNATLYLIGPFADLSLAKTVSNASPTSGAAISYTLSVTNSGSSTTSASGVQVRDILPAGFTYTGASGTGSYNSTSGIWTVGTVPVGATRSITINGSVAASSGATVTNTAEIIASSLPDPDSTVNNGATGEDDYASRSFTVTGARGAGTPPSINAICTSANSTTNLLDWNNQSWTSGSPTGSATLAGIGTINFSVATQGTYMAPLELNSSNTGGFGAGQLSLYQIIEYTNRDQVTTTTVTLPTAVPGAQFTVFDVDYAVNDFADKLTVTGSFNGTPVMPMLTNGVVNYTAGNVAIGDGGSDATSANGNVVVTFSSPIDSIVIVYGNHTTAPADPDGQAISLYDFTFCNPKADLSVTKISSVLNDPVNGNTDPKAIPGATIRYCILVTNSGSATATSVMANDILPARVTFVPGSIRSGSTCNGAATVEDDNNSGADENDPYGASINGTTITLRGNTLGPNTSFATTFQAIVD